MNVYASGSKFCISMYKLSLTLYATWSVGGAAACTLSWSYYLIVIAVVLCAVSNVEATRMAVAHAHVYLLAAFRISFLRKHDCM